MKPARHVEAETAAGRGALLGERQRQRRILWRAPALRIAAREAALAVATLCVIRRRQQPESPAVVLGNTWESKKEKPGQMGSCQ